MLTNRFSLIQFILTHSPWYRFSSQTPLTRIADATSSVRVLGVLDERSPGQYYLLDPVSELRLDLSNVRTTVGFFCVGCTVVVTGVVEKDIVSSVLRAQTIETSLVPAKGLDEEFRAYLRKVAGGADIPASCPSLPCPDPYGIWSIEACAGCLQPERYPHSLASIATSLQGSTITRRVAAAVAQAERLQGQVRVDVLSDLRLNTERGRRMLVAYAE